jgi:hypothetical protein
MDLSERIRNSYEMNKNSRNKLFRSSDSESLLSFYQLSTIFKYLHGKISNVNKTYHITDEEIRLDFFSNDNY